MTEEYSHEDIVRALLGSKSVKEITEMMLVSIAKLSLRIDACEESIDAIVEDLEKLSDGDD
jgi:hypothetical protein